MLIVYVVVSNSPTGGSSGGGCNPPLNFQKKNSGNSRGRFDRCSLVDTSSNNACLRVLHGIIVWMKTSLVKTVSHMYRGLDHSNVMVRPTLRRS